MDERICVICGKKFYSNHRSKKTCGPECQIINRQRQQRIYNHSVRMGKKEEKRTCIICGKVFYTNHRTKKTCGQNCQREMYRRQALRNYHKNHELDAQHRREIKKVKEKPKRPKTDWRAIGRKLKELNKSYGQAVADGDI